MLVITINFVALYSFTGFVGFIIISLLAGVESGDQCLLNSDVLFCFSGVIMSIRSFFSILNQFLWFSKDTHSTALRYGSYQKLDNTNLQLKE